MNEHDNANRLHPEHSRFGHRTGKDIRKSYKADYDFYVPVGLLALVMLCIFIATGTPQLLAYMLIPPTLFILVFGIAIHYSFKWGFKKGDSVPLEQALIPPPELRKRSWMVRRSDDPASVSDLVTEHIIRSIAFVLISVGVIRIVVGLFEDTHHYWPIIAIIVLISLAYLGMCFFALRRAYRLGYKTALKKKALGSNARKEAGDSQAAQA